MDKNKRPYISLLIQIVLLVLIVLSGFLALISGITTVKYVFMWFVAIIQTLGLVVDCYQYIERGDTEDEED